jgi:GTP-binding protein HflX
VQAVLIERPRRRGERVVLVHVDFNGTKQTAEIDEFQQLAVSAGGVPIATINGRRSAPNPRYFVGSGKVTEIRQRVEELHADLVIFNHALTPAQERNLEQYLQCRVVDRTGLILDIFSQRAHTFEGKLQVELAQLRHLSTRLVRGWTHLERQKGGIGLRGPGETQLETDRRLIRERIKHLNKRLEKVRAQREGRRKSRRKADLKTVSLVGYTNTGKSTLFNRLTGASVYSADQLFATLDPTLRRLSLPGHDPVLLVDTVGFIRHLPHSLVAAFRATLEETREAHLLLHVVDAGDENRRECVDQVNEVLREIGADVIPQIEVYNKIDLMGDVRPHADFDEKGAVKRVWLSAHTGEGLDLLREVIVAHFHAGGTLLSEKPVTEGANELDLARDHQAPASESETAESL